MKIKLQYIVCFWLLIAPNLIFCQKEFKSNLLNFNAALPSDFVNNCIKKDNILYIATQRGLCYYDGYRFENHKTIKTNIYNLCVKNNTIYFYDSQKGLCVLNKFNENAKIIAPNNYNDVTPNNDHYDNIYVDSKNRIWCSDINNIKYFNSNSSKKNSFEFDKNNTDINKPITFIEFKNADIWFATYKGLFVWNQKTKTMQDFDNFLLRDLKIKSAVLVNNNDLYLATFDGKLLIYNVLNNTVKLLYNFTKNESISKIEFNNESLVLSSYRKLYQFNIKNQELLEIYDAKNIHINDFLIDDDAKCYWVSTNRGLVQVNNDTAIENIKIPTAIPKTVVSIVQDADETIFFALNSNEVWSYSKNHIWKNYMLPSGICKDLSVYKNQILVATSNGLFSIENQQIQELKLNNYTKDLKKCIVDLNGNLWILPSKGIIAVFDFKTLTQKQNFIQNTDAFWSGNSWNDILCDTFGTIWVAGWMPKSNGIIKFDFQTNRFIDVENFESNKIKNDFSGDFFNKIAEINNHKLLFSSFGGWNILDKMGNVTFGYHTYKQELPSDHIVGICDDLAGNIWFATSEGLNVYNTKTAKTRRISQIDGLLTDDLTNGFCKLKNRSIVLGNENGFSIVNTKQILKHTIKNNLKLISVKIDGEIIPNNTQPIIIENANSEFTLLFSDLSYSNKLKVFYRYKFKDDQNWNYLGNKSELTLVKLASGTYNLQIQTGDNFNNWQPQLLNIRVEVKPKYYETWWFISICFLFIALVIFAVNWYLLKQQKIKNKLTQDIKNAEMKTLRSQMNPHFMFNTLNSINRYIIENKSNEASKYLTMFSKLMRNILENSKYSEITVENEIKTLKLYMQLEAVRLDNKFDFSITIADKIDQETLKIPPLILQPFVENAIWHGLHNKKEHGHLKIKIDTQEDNFFSIQIIDDGVGRKATSIIKKQQTNHKSYGIDITIARLKMLNECNSVEIIDLYNNHEIPSGTQVNIKIYF